MQFFHFLKINLYFGKTVIVKKNLGHLKVGKNQNGPRCDKRGLMHNEFRKQMSKFKCDLDSLNMINPINF